VSCHGDDVLEGDYADVTRAFDKLVRVGMLLEIYIMIAATDDDV
jgi:hypothetical protein